MDDSFVLNKDNKLLTFHGKPYRSLTDPQIACLEALEKDFKAGGNGLHEDNLVKISGKSYGRVKDIFKTMEGWRDIIKRVKTKTYCLKLKKKPVLKLSASLKPLKIYQGYLKKIIANGKKLMKSRLIDKNIQRRGGHNDTKSKKEFFKRRHKWRHDWLGALKFALREDVNYAYYFILGQKAVEVFAEDKYGSGKKAVEIEISFLEKMLSTKNKTTFLSDDFIKNPTQINEYL